MTGVTNFVIRGSEKVFIITSGPMPLISPTLIPILSFVFRSSESLILPFFEPNFDKPSMKGGKLRISK